MEMGSPMSTEVQTLDFMDRIPADPKYFFEVVMSDGTKEVRFPASDVIWPLATDGFIVIKVPYVPLELAEVFDGWDGGSAELTVSVQAKCTNSPYGHWICPSQDVLDYNSISGKGKITDPRECIQVTKADGTAETVCGGWKYSAKGTSEIPILFSEWE